MLNRIKKTVPESPSKVLFYSSWWIIYSEHC